MSFSIVIKQHGSPSDPDRASPAANVKDLKCVTAAHKGREKYIKKLRKTHLKNPADDYKRICRPLSKV